jgi:hypothetical protein
MITTAHLAATGCHTQQAGTPMRFERLIWG